MIDFESANRYGRRFTLIVFIVMMLFVSSAQAAPELAPENERATKILVDKSDRSMVLMRDGRELQRYKISLGFFAPRGHKQRSGDRRTPEGDYFISERKANSQFHLALRISYPNERDRASAQARKQSPGGDIMIHGGTGTKLSRRGDWTLGCIAVTNKEIEEIWRLIPLNTPISIVP